MDWRLPTSLSIIYIMKKNKIFLDFKSAYKYWKEIGEKYDYFKYNIDIYTDYDNNTKACKYIVSIRYRLLLKYEYSVLSIYENEFISNLQRDLVDEINDLYDNIEGIKKAKRINYIEKMRNSRHDKNVYCDICGKYQTRQEYKKYKMCKKCYNS